MLRSKTATSSLASLIHLNAKGVFWHVRTDTASNHSFIKARMHNPVDHMTPLTPQWESIKIAWSCFMLCTLSAPRVLCAKIMVIIIQADLEMRGCRDDEILMRSELI
jgi:hypothetical protein